MRTARATSKPRLASIAAADASTRKDLLSGRPRVESRSGRFRISRICLDALTSCGVERPFGYLLRGFAGILPFASTDESLVRSFGCGVGVGVALAAAVSCARHPGLAGWRPGGLGNAGGNGGRVGGGRDGTAARRGPIARARNLAGWMLTEQARRVHPMLGERQEQMLPLLASGRAWNNSGSRGLSSTNREHEDRPERDGQSGLPQKVDAAAGVLCCSDSRHG